MSDKEKKTNFRKVIKANTGYTKTSIMKTPLVHKSNEIIRSTETSSMVYNSDSSASRKVRSMASKSTKPRDQIWKPFEPSHQKSGFIHGEKIRADLSSSPEPHYPSEEKIDDISQNAHVRPFPQDDSYEKELQVGEHEYPLEELKRDNRSVSVPFTLKKSFYSSSTIPHRAETMNPHQEKNIQKFNKKMEWLNVTPNCQRRSMEIDKEEVLREEGLRQNTKSSIDQPDPDHKSQEIIDSNPFLKNRSYSEDEEEKPIMPSMSLLGRDDRAISEMPTYFKSPNYEVRIPNENLPSKAPKKTKKEINTDLIKSLAQKISKMNITELFEKNLEENAKKGTIFSLLSPKPCLREIDDEDDDSEEENECENENENDKEEGKEEEKKQLNSVITKVGGKKSKHSKKKTEDPFKKAYKDHLQQTLESISFIKDLKQNDELLELIKKKKIHIPSQEQKSHMVVFDLDETLVHCIDNPQKADVNLTISLPGGDPVNAAVMIRPHALKCLEKANEWHEVVIFTASHQCYADVILDYLDPERKLTKNRLYRDNCIKTGAGIYIKDLRIINRDLKNITIIDNAAYSFAFQIENGVPIIPYYDDKNDTILNKIIDYMDNLRYYDDVRDLNEKQFRLKQLYDSNVADFITYYMTSDEDEDSLDSGSFRDSPTLLAKPSQLGRSWSKSSLSLQEMEKKARRDSPNNSNSAAQIHCTKGVIAHLDKFQDSLSSSFLSNSKKKTENLSSSFTMMDMRNSRTPDPKNGSTNSKKSNFKK